MLWGITPVLDFQNEYKNVKNHHEDIKELNILIIGGTDARHVLQTIAKRYRHTNKIKLNFFIMESCMETLARQLLFLNISLQPQTTLGLDQKTKIFMELYGNSLIRPSVAKYLTCISKDLVEMVTNFEYMRTKMHCVSLQIKYKERDYLENLLKFWCGKDQFNIVDAWDRRLRRSLGVRYDSKVGAFDWDLHMRYRAIGGSQVCNQEYRNFRLNGVAFSWLESEVSKPNRTMVCAIFPNGSSFAHHGYLGDMVTGPFVGFGLNCEDKEYLKSSNGHNTYRSTDVFERNLKQMLYEIEYQTEYVHRKLNDLNLGTAVIKEEILIVDVKSVEVASSVKQASKCFELNDVTINFLSLSLWDSMKHREEFKYYFDLVYFGHSYVKHIDTNTLEIICKDNGSSLIIVERPLFELSLREKHLDQYDRSITDKLNSYEFVNGDYDKNKVCYMKFVMKQLKE